MVAVDCPLGFFERPAWNVEVYTDASCRDGLASVAAYVFMPKKAPFWAVRYGYYASVSHVAEEIAMEFGRAEALKRLGRLGINSPEFVPMTIYNDCQSAVLAKRRDNDLITVSYTWLSRRHPGIRLAHKRARWPKCRKRVGVQHDG